MDVRQERRESAGRSVHMALIVMRLAAHHQSGRAPAAMNPPSTGIAAPVT
jgi:hypothetical protein